MRGVLVIAVAVAAGWSVAATAQSELCAASASDPACGGATPAGSQRETAPAPERPESDAAPDFATFRDCDVCPEMIALPAGASDMGAPVSEPESEDDARPVHRVSVPRFAMGRTEVTVGEFRRFIETTGRTAGASCNTDEGGWLDRATRGWRNPGFPQGEDHPVVCVNPADARAYVDWLNGQVDGKPYHLPSEAEWEYAARAGTTTPFWTGQRITTDQANFNGYRSYNGSPEGPYRERTVPVGSLPANPWGLHEMNGNAFEWVQDCWNKTYVGAPSDGSAWMSGECDEAVLRGGAWRSDPWFLRSAQRSSDRSDLRNFYIGFRVARTLGR